MRKTFYYDREEIYKKILMSKQTRCGVYWINSELLNKKGNKNDADFLIERKLFENKCFWTQKDLSYLMAKHESDKLFLSDWINLNTIFNEQNKDLSGKKLSDYIGLNKVSEIIDNYLYIKDYHYSI